MKFSCKKLIAAAITVLLSMAVFGILPLAGTTVNAAMPEMKNVKISSDGILSWDAVAGATNYEWFIGSGGGNAEDTQVDLKQACLDFGFTNGTYDVKLYAEKNGEQISMAWEGTYSYTSAKPQLATPSNLAWNGNIATWDAVPNAESYSVVLDGANCKTVYGVTTNSCDMSYWLKDGTGEYTFKVWADAKGYPTSEMSEWSAYATLTMTRPELQNVQISSDGILSWDAFDGAVTYDCDVGINFNGNTEKTELDLDEYCQMAGYGPGTYDIELCAYSDYGWKGGYQISAVWTGTYTYKGVKVYEVSVVSGYYDGGEYPVVDTEGISGTVSLSKTRVKQGDEVKVTVKPNIGYKIKQIVWSNDFGTPTNITYNGKFTVGDGQPIVCVYFEKYAEYIASADCTITVPVAGEHPDMNPVSSDPEKYDVEISYWYLPEGSCPHLKSTDVFVAGKTYAVRVYFTAKTGYIFENGTTEFTINGDYFGMVALFGPEARFKAEGTATLDGWAQSGDIWQYFESGIAVTGWKQVSGAWYYFLDNGNMVTGWQEIDGTWYYFNGSGAMATKWQQIRGKWYYFAGSGVMVTGWKQLSGTWYYFRDNGAMATGWEEIDGTYYYFRSSGAMVTGWQEIDGVYYYFKPNGAMAANEYCGGYWLDASGKWTYKAKAEWKQDSKGWYYQDTNGWYAKNGTWTIDGKDYNFDAQGYCTNP